MISVLVSFRSIMRVGKFKQHTLANIMKKILIIPSILIFAGCATVEQMQSHVPTEPQGGKVYCETFETHDGKKKHTYDSSKENSRLVYVSEVAHDSGKGTTLTMCFEK